MLRSILSKLKLKIVSKIKWRNRIKISSYIYYNYLCKRIIRMNGHKIIPYKHTHISIAPSAKIYLDGDMILNINRQKGSRQECLILLRDNAELYVNGLAELYYGTTLQVHNNAKLIMGEVHMNTGTTVVCGYKINIGNRVSTARGVFIYDSDHHPIYNADGKCINEPKEVIISDHVWIGLKSTVLKGTTIDPNAIISANSLVSGHVYGNAITASPPARPVMKDVYWER